MLFEKNHFPFLQFRETVLDTAPLEEKYGITLPPIYRSFISVFKPFLAERVVGDENTKIGFAIPLYSSKEAGSVTEDDDEMAFESFKDLEDVLSFPRSNEDYLKGYLFIANHGYSGGLLVGIGEDNMDKIYHNTDSEIITYKADNIFEILHKMHLVKYDFPSYPKVDTNRLYKNFGEDFWRIREAKS